MNDYYRGKHDILLLNLLSNMSVQEESQLVSELERAKPPVITLDLDDILNTFGDDYEKLVKSIREQVYYKAAISNDNDSIDSSYLTDKLIDRLSLPTNDQYSTNLGNSVTLMLNNLESQGLSTTLAEWLIFAVMWDQPPYDYVKFIIDLWRHPTDNNDFTPGNVISINSLKTDNIIDRFLRAWIENASDYVQDLDPLIEYHMENLDTYYWDHRDIDIDSHIDFIYATYHHLAHHSNPQLAYDIIEALIREESIDLLKLVYEYLRDSGVIRTT